MAAVASNRGHDGELRGKRRSPCEDSGPVEQETTPLPRTVEGRQLAAELVKFVREQASKAKPGERLPGSTEVLESCFGRFKTLEKRPSQGGIHKSVAGVRNVIRRSDNR